MYRRQRVTGVVLAAGNSTRMGLEINKVYVGVGGKAAVLYSLEALDRHPYVDEITAVARQRDRAELTGLMEAAGLHTPWRIVPGGDTRQQSVYNAISGLNSGIVLIQDGARPMIRPEYISRCVEAMGQYAGAVVAIPVTEPICRLEKSGRVRPLDPSGLYAAQTPQCFRTKVLRRCHEKHRSGASVTDDSSLLELEGQPVGLIPGDRENIKLTTAADLRLAEALLTWAGRE